MLGITRERLRQVIDVAPAPFAADMRAELADVDRMDAMVASAPPAYLSKVSRDSYHRMNRKRGRAARPDDNGSATP